MYLNSHACIARQSIICKCLYISYCIKWQTEYTTLKYDFVISTSNACTLAYSFQIHIIKMSSNFQVQDEIQEKNPASTNISLHKFASVLSGLIPLNTFKSIIHLQTNTSVFLTTIQGLGNLNWFSFSLKAPQIFFTWSQNFSHLVHCVCPKCYVSYALEPRSGYVPNIRGRAWG